MALYPPNIEVVLAGLPRSKGSKAFIVDVVNGNDSNPGTKWEQPLATFEAAYALATTLKNDVILLVGNGSPYPVSAALALNKNYVHIVGLTPEGTMEPRVVINCPAGLVTTPFITFSGSGCVVKNITFRHNTTSALGLVNFYLSGSYNYFKNCQFAGGVGTNAVTGARHLKLVAAMSNTFDGCEIGQDETALPDGAAGVEFLSLSAHNIFKDCIFLVNTAGTTYVHCLIAAAADTGAMNQYLHSNFYNTGAGVEAEAIIIGAALSGVKRHFLVDCQMYGATEWNLSNNGLVTNVEIAANFTGVATGGLMMLTS